MSKSMIASSINATASIFDTIANTANTATKLVNTVNTGVDMLDRMVVAANNRHRHDTNMAQEAYFATSTLEAQMAEAEIVKNQQIKLANDPILRQLCEESKARYEALSLASRAPTATPE